jgi:hypothetical protein
MRELERRALYSSWDRDKTVAARMHVTAFVVASPASSGDAARLRMTVADTPFE